MSKRRPKKVVPTIDRTPRLRKALAKRTKDELLDILVELAREDHKILRWLNARVGLASPPHELAAATRQAIVDATDFDERDVNRNFHYDYEAYGEVKRNLSRMIELDRTVLGDGAFAGADASSQLSGRDERRGLDDRGYRRMPARSLESPPAVQPAIRRDPGVGALR